MSDDDSRSPEENFQAGVTDSIRKAVFGGISSLFMNEESIKGQLGELPRDALNYLVGQTEKTRHEFVNIVTREFKEFLANVDWSKELPKILEGMNIEVTANIRLRRADGEPAVDLKTRIVQDPLQDGSVPNETAPEGASTESENE